MRDILAVILAAAIVFFGAVYLIDSGDPWTPMIIDYVFSDYPDEQRVEVTYTNYNEFAVCMSVEDWPNKAGKMMYANDRVFLVVEDRRFPVVEFNTGYCVPRSACIIKVESGSQIKGSITYQDFDLPEALWLKEKSLIYTPLGHQC